MRKAPSKANKSPFGRWETQVLLFFLFLFLYCWPFLTDFGRGRPQILYSYFYVVFALQIIVLALIGKALGGAMRDSDNNPQGK
jgi:hypothetical protein